MATFLANCFLPKLPTSFIGKPWMIIPNMYNKYNPFPFEVKNQLFLYDLFNTHPKGLHGKPAEWIICIDTVCKGKGQLLIFITAKHHIVRLILKYYHLILCLGRMESYKMDYNTLHIYHPLLYVESSQSWCRKIQEIELSYC
jgi:hypothetical protein